VIEDNKNFYNSDEVEKKAQEFWEKNNSFEVSEDDNKEKFYCLSMFPYPSGNLHMGHVRNYTLGDVISRFNRMLGKNVLQPIGWDAFGLPAENAALQNKVQPSDWTYKNIKNMKSQLKSMGFSYDWKREFATCDEDYYKWEQWFFLELVKKDLAYQEEAEVNWDPVDMTVLANEQVIDGKGWRSGAIVEKKIIKQWFLRISNFSEELLKGLDSLEDWPEQVKTMQRNWIGYSEGMEFRFKIETGIEEISVFTTRPDTIMGVSFIALSPNHSVIQNYCKNNNEISDFLKQVNKVKVSEADFAKQEKIGVNTGLFAIHPFSGKKIEIWAANFVISDYGSGALMGVPGHDQRDFEFAKKYNLSIKKVIQPFLDDKEEVNLKKNVLINSDEFNGLNYDEAFIAILNKATTLNCGDKKTNYRLRDWGISRQRYWGTPIPILKDSDGKNIPAFDLPVSLPKQVKFKGVSSPLKDMKEFLSLKHKNKEYERETDTFDTFFESSWYFARFASYDSKESMLDERVNYWLPVDQYIGGIEHAILHLLYSRFFYKCLRELKLVKGDEPFTKLLCQGMVLKDGFKMSKSKGNTVDPEPLIKKYGADTVRLFILFAAPPEQTLEWSDEGLKGSSRFIKKIWNLIHDHIKAGIPDGFLMDPKSEEEIQLRRKTHQTILKVRDDYERRQTFNTAIAAIMELTNTIPNSFLDVNASLSKRRVVHETIHAIVLMLSPVTPHLCHHLWQILNTNLKKDILNESWPKEDRKALINDQLEIAIQVNGKLRNTLKATKDMSREEIQEIAISDETINKYISKREIQRIIYVPGKIVNIVIKDEKN
tara:strand:- start:23091 stop:25559 length:2469 start_codon:yes stop_codon:yes gene_type:complete